MFDVKLIFLGTVGVPPLTVWGTQAVSNAKDIVKADSTAPTVTGFSYNSTTHELTLSFSEAVELADTASAVATEIQGKLSAPAGVIGTASGAVLSTDAKSITVTLSGEALDQYSPITISAGAFTTITDASGNTAVRSQSTAYPLTITQ